MSRPSAARQPGLPFIFVTLLLDTIGIGVIIPVVPGMIAHLTGSTSSAARFLGVLVAAFSLAQLLFAPTLGALSDRYGRRPILLVSTLLSSLSYLLAAFAPSLAWLLAARTLGGIGGATVGVSYAYITDITAPSERGKAFGLAGAAFGLGLMIGPAIGGLLGQHGLTWPFLAASLLALLNLLYGWFVLPESRQPTHAPIALASLVPLRALGILGRFPGLPMLAAVVITMNLAQQFLTSTWVLHGTVRYGWTANMNGLSLALGGVLGIVVQALLLPRVLAKWGVQRTATFGFVVGVIGNALYGLSSQPWMLFASMVIASLAGLAQPAVQALIASRTPPQMQGAVQGAVGGLGSLCAVAGPLMATSLFAAFTATGSPPYLPGIAFFGAAGLILLGLLVLSACQPAQKERLAHP